MIGLRRHALVSERQFFIGKQSALDVPDISGRRLARENIVLLRPESVKYARSRFCRHVLNIGDRANSRRILLTGIGLIVGPRKVYNSAMS